LHLVMFDIDGTLIESCDFDADCFFEAVKVVTGYELNTDWESYQNITDAGILDEFITRHKLDHQRELLHKKVKDQFVQLVSSHLAISPASEIDGAIDFLRQLQSRTDIEVAIATGGWEDTAKIKLQSAGFDVSGLAFASSSDAIQRTKVMQVSESRCSHQRFISKTYFGDGVWDRRASEALSYNFVLVGNKLHHSKQIDNFQNAQLAIMHIGL
jgi:phosphoglycolate phosphatase-like HAD superfamily hydrolase